MLVAQRCTGEEREHGVGVQHGKAGGYLVRILQPRHPCGAISVRVGVERGVIVGSPIVDVKHHTTEPATEEHWHTVVLTALTTTEVHHWL